MTHELSLNEIKKEWHGTLKSYLIGFTGSLLLTALSFSLVAFKLIAGQFLIYTIVGLALAQAILQLIYFMHLGQEDRPQWESITFYFMVIVLLIIAVGSLWIMHDLNERVMSNMSMEMVHD